MNISGTVQCSTTSGFPKPFEVKEEFECLMALSGTFALDSSWTTITMALTLPSSRILFETRPVVGVDLKSDK